MVIDEPDNFLSNQYDVTLLKRSQIISVALWWLAAVMITSPADSMLAGRTRATTKTH